MSPTEPTASITKPEELLRVAQEYADLFNAHPMADVDRLIADACIDPLWDERTNLLSFVAHGPEDLGLVLANDDEDYVIVRFADSWVVDTSAVDWEALEDEAFDCEDDEELDDEDEADDDFGDPFDGAAGPT